MATFLQGPGLTFIVSGTSHHQGIGTSISGENFDGMKILKMSYQLINKD